MESQQLAQFEQISEKLYQPANTQEHKEAEEALAPFSQSPEYVVQLRFVLDNSSSPFAQMFAASALKKLVSTHWNRFPVQSRVEIRTYVLTYLANNGAKLTEHVVNGLVEILARVTKMGWFDDPAMQETVVHVQTFLQPASPTHSLIGLKILCQIIHDMNTTPTTRTMNEHRKVACAFRDKSLLRVFQLSLTTLKALAQGSFSPDQSLDTKLREYTLRLAYQSLSFDFIGTQPEASTEDNATIQIPAVWKSIFEDPATMQLFWSIYARSSPPVSSKAMECLVQMACVRRTLLTAEPQREQYLSQLILGINETLRTKQGLNEPDNYHQFCRLLDRLKGNYQLTWLASAEGYEEWIKLTAEFTFQSFRSWQWSANSIYYLLHLWSRLINSVAYAKENMRTYLEDYGPQVFEAYVASRLDSVAVVIQNPAIDDPLDLDVDDLYDQLDSVPHLGRSHYQKSAAFVTGLFDTLFREFEAIAVVSSPRLLLVEGQLTWLVYIVGALVGGRSGIAPQPAEDTFDAELISRVLKLMSYHSAILNQAVKTESRARLELAFLRFWQCMRKAYLGDRNTHTSAMWLRLEQLLQVPSHPPTHDQLAAMIVNKIAANLKEWVKNAAVMKNTLDLFHDIITGYNSHKLFTHLDATKQILEHHTNQFLGFFDVADSGRIRTTFYETLGRILFMNDRLTHYDNYIFVTFMHPFSEKMQALLELNTLEAFRQEKCKTMLIGLCRDLTGLFSACTNSQPGSPPGSSCKVCYTLLFDWLYPAWTPVLVRAAEVFYDTPSVIVPLLKLVAEFTSNRGIQRISFDSSSPNGILLFKETSKILCAYGSRICTVNAQALSNPYAEKYKGIQMCLLILVHALCGNFCNFGVLALYGDRALVDALDVVLKLAVSVPLDQIMSYPKLKAQFFNLVDSVFQHHLEVLLELDPAIFLQLVTSVAEGIQSPETPTTTSCCSALDHLASYHFKNRNRPVVQRLNKCMLEQNPDLYPSLLQLMIRIFLFEHPDNSWSFSRAIFSVILACPTAFATLKTQLAASQPPEVRGRLEECFKTLMLDVTDMLELRERDKFTQQLNQFAKEAKKFLVGSS